MARIDRLAAEDKRVLQAAAVIGRNLPFLLLQAILDPADEALRERLARLQSAEFLYETRAASELEYTFKHALTHEVAYASLLPAQRRALHARIVDVARELAAGGPGGARRAARAPRDPGRGVGEGRRLRAARGAPGDDPVGAPGCGGLVRPGGGGAGPPARAARAPRAGDRPPVRSAERALAAGRVPAGLRLSQARGAARDDAGRPEAAGDDVRAPDAHVLDAGGSGPGHRVRPAGARPRRRRSETPRSRSWRACTWPWRTSRWATTRGRRSSPGRT